MSEPHRVGRVRTRRSAGGPIAAQLAVVFIVEAALAATILTVGPPDRWWSTLVMAVTATGWWNTAYLLLRGVRPPFEVAGVVVWHLHVLAAAMRIRPSGPPWTLAVLATAGYTALVVFWTRARRRERRAGLTPGVGIGGIGLVAAQRHPQTATLAHRHAGSPAGRPVLLLHGLALTATIWDRTIAALDGQHLDIIAPDLLGFGASRRIATSFTLTDQAAALTRLQHVHETGRATVVGHSWGCAVAAAFVAFQPHAVDRVVLVNPPVFDSPQEAVVQLANAPWMTRITLSDSLTAELACGLMCLMRPTLRLMAPLWWPATPASVARASVDHIWPALRAGIHALTHDQTLSQLLASPTHPTTVVLALDDETAPPGNVRRVLAPAVDTVAMIGGHGLPLTRPRRIAQLIARR